MFGAVKVQNASSSVFNHKEAVECSKVQRGNRKEVEGGEELAMVVQKRRPSLRFAFIISAPEALKVARNRRFGNIEPQLDQFAVDARSAPAWILGFHTPDQLADLLIDPRSLRLSRTPPPKQTEAGAMPGHDRLRFDDYESISPT